MKTKVTILLLSLITAFVFSAEAQHLKIGYADPNYIMENMPDTKRIQSELQTYEKQLQNQLQAKYKEYQDKAASLEQGGSAMLPSVKEDKMKELAFLEQSIKDFEEKAQEDLQKKQMSLVNPLLDKIQKAIDAVAEEQGYTYIFTKSAPQYGGVQTLLYAKNKSEDISDLVLKKLGVTPPVQGTGTTTPVNNGTNPTNTTTTPKK